MTEIFESPRIYARPAVLLVGEAPNRRMHASGTEKDDALIIPRLISMSGLGEEDYRSSFARMNLLDEWPGRDPGGEGDAFPSEEARKALPRLMEKIEENQFQRVILCGSRVASVVNRHLSRLGTMRFFSWRRFCPDPSSSYSPFLAAVPHPSGTARWWNDPGNVEKAYSFWREQGTWAVHTSTCFKCSIGTDDPEALPARRCGIPPSQDKTFYEAYIAHAAARPSISHAWWEGKCLCGWTWRAPS